ncbi:MAG: JAB domain-containing protein [Tsuneonella sp.]
MFDREQKYICAFDRKGTRGQIALNYRDLIERALANGAGGMLLLHNHPSGDPTPSPDDTHSTRMLDALCRPLDIQLHDHLIVAGQSLLSMRRSGVL